MLLLELKALCQQQSHAQSAESLAAQLAVDDVNLVASMCATLVRLGYLQEAQTACTQCPVGGCGRTPLITRYWSVD